MRRTIDGFQHRGQSALIMLRQPMTHAATRLMLGRSSPSQCVLGKTSADKLLRQGRQVVVRITTCRCPTDALLTCSAPPAGSEDGTHVVRHRLGRVIVAHVDV